MIVIPNAKLTKRKLLLLLVNIHGRRINADAKAIAEAWRKSEPVRKVTFLLTGRSEW